MPDYKNGRIYKIVCNITGMKYIGSTCQPLYKRLAGHVSAYKAGNNQGLTSINIISNGNYKIVLIENYPCNSKEELIRRERYHIEALECVNHNKPFIHLEEKPGRRIELKEISNQLQRIQYMECIDSNINKSKAKISPRYRDHILNNFKHLSNRALDTLCRGPKKDLNLYISIRDNTPIKRECILLDCMNEDELEQQAIKDQEERTRMKIKQYLKKQKQPDTI